MATAGSIITDFEVSGQDGRGTIAPQHPLTLASTDEKEPSFKDVKLGASAETEEAETDEMGEKPTEEERKTLRLVAASIPLTAYAICLVEFAERASYYGVSNVFSNFIQRSLPIGGNGAGAVGSPEQSAGALGMGLQAASGLTKTFSFLAYLIPILGGIIADTKWGKFKTICWGTGIGFVAHVILVIAAIPSVIASGKAALAPFIIGLLSLAFATGFIKPCIAPLLADQSPVVHQRVITLPSGERVIVDPSATVQNLLGYYYLCVNIGSVFSIATSYSAKEVGFWLAYLVPGIIYLLMPIVLWWIRNRVIRVEPQGSVVLDSLKVIKTTFQKGGVRDFLKGDQERLFEKAKPSRMEEFGIIPKKAGWVSWDDDFVDELRRTVKACKLFLFFPIFLMADGGVDSVLGSMGGSMTSKGVPNDLLNNFNSITIIFMVPLMNFVVYPALRRRKINFSPIKRICFGFFLCTIQMVIAAILQWRVYETSPCGYYATTCVLPDGSTGVSPISIWAQVPLFALPATAEIFINITSYEIAITRAPQRMKGLVFAIVLSMSSLSSALSLIITPALIDPNLIWPLAGVGIANFICIPVIWHFFHKMDNDVEVFEIGVDRKIEVANKPVQDEEKA